MIANILYTLFWAVIIHSAGTHGDRGRGLFTGDEPISEVHRDRVYQNPSSQASKVPSPNLSACFQILLYTNLYTNGVASM